MKKYFTAFVSLAITASMLFTTFVGAYDGNPSVTVNNDSIHVIRLDENVERIFMDDVEIEDVTSDINRTITTKAGNDISIYDEDFATGIATLTVNGQIVETYDMTQIREDISVWTMPEEDERILNEYLDGISNTLPHELPNELSGRYTISAIDSGVLISPNNSTRATTAEPSKPYPEVDEANPTYMYKTMQSRSVYSSVCGRTLSMKVKDSMYSYASVKQTHKIFSAGTAVSIIAGTFNITSSVVITSLKGVTQTVGGVLKLISSVDYYFSEEYSYHAMRQGYVFDYTTLNRDVSVLTKNGYGKLSLTWDLVNGEYTNPQWKHSAQAEPFTISYSTIINDAKDVWEYNIQEYGSWQWGDI